MGTWEKGAQPARGGARWLGVEPTQAAGTGKIPMGPAAGQNVVGVGCGQGGAGWAGSRGQKGVYGSQGKGS